jgi:2-polyprenyl-6-methoxyphenol hydroxylase-like FAD-dependent oxidoreductase
MNSREVDLVIVGAGPVGLMCAHLAHISGLTAVAIDKSDGPLKAGRADALNARTLQLLEIAGLFTDLHPQGRPCKTSSIWANGGFVSRQSKWWDELQGCFHKHFLMLGQSFLETLLDERLQQAHTPVLRKTSLEEILVNENGCITTLTNGEKIKSQFVIGADGSRSFVREKFKIPFEITRPRLTWAVIDGVIETDFEKVPEIIVFQAETSDVAWIPREGKIDRFYVRMDTQSFTLEDAVIKINRAMSPHILRFKEIVWFSQFSVKESVAEKFQVHDRVFLAGDACHIHSVNGGQGLNTGLGDAFNLIWKLKKFLRENAPLSLLKTFEAERKAVALNVVETSGELVRATKFSANGTHAEDYIKIVEKRAGNITGMGVRYGEAGLIGTRLFDMEIREGSKGQRLYSRLDYSKLTLLIFDGFEVAAPDAVQVLRISTRPKADGLWTECKEYEGKAILVRPDAYIENVIGPDSREPQPNEWQIN